ncbi:MAG: aldehyde dehydrogenase family protein [Halioglobus sp.]
MDREGYFFEPTIVADLTDGSRLVDKEPFGPIVPIIKYTDIDEVIERANRLDKGLGGSVWSSDAARAAELAQRLECGSAWVNDHGAIQPDAPFGGVKQSGIGVEFSLYGLEEYTSIQTLEITHQVQIQARCRAESSRVDWAALGVRSPAVLDDQK